MPRFSTEDRIMIKRLDGGTNYQLQLPGFSPSFLGSWIEIQYMSFCVLLFCKTVWHDGRTGDDWTLGSPQRNARGGSAQLSLLADSLQAAALAQLQGRA